ncbi:hypothetical protein [Methanoculleus sp.]|uniref:hypothetical protein n=1 Tax=Methanoculleus sp. TaxID=90427 RepID=UPI002600D180|nr:hypothetical protein [Methanoculleus sp.]MCK9319426.1 hypothetical protein [Methanoculleus sp.]
MSKKLTYDYVSNVFNSNDYILLSNIYINNSSKLKVMCPNKHVFEISFSNFQAGKRCPICYGNKTYDFNEVKEFIEIKSNSGCVLISKEYNNNHSKLNIQCKCGNIFKTTFNRFKNGNKRQCNKCSYKNKPQYQSKSHEDFCKEVYELVGNEYTVLGKYINNKTHILIRHNNCGKTYEVMPTNFISPHNYNRCPECNKSKGEKKIRDVLDLINIKYIPQKEFEGLIGTGGGNLSYDFYLPKCNLLIEYQGQFHDGSSGEYSKKNLKTQQEHDKRKRDYALKYNIKLLEIWYWDFERIEEILYKELYNYKQRTSL